jgi:hypothetical protein
MDAALCNDFPIERESPMTMFRRHAACVLVLPILCTACDFESSVAPRVELPVVVDSEGMIDFVNAEGYTIRLTRMRVAFENVEFTTGGETHMALLRPLVDLVIPTAYAHPGHYAGGEVIGEMDGRFVVDWLDDRARLGNAVMIESDYNGANFVFTRAQPGDGIEADDPLVGHTFEIAGVATKDGESWTFSGFVDEDEGRRVIGLPFELDVDASSDETLGLQLLPKDPAEADTAFDDLDFAALDDDGDGVVTIVPGEPAGNVLKKHLQIHDHYAVTME